LLWVYLRGAVSWRRRTRGQLMACWMMTGEAGSRVQVS
jgi:hypothetical protein